MKPEYTHKSYLYHFLLALGAGLIIGFRIIPANVVAFGYLAIIGIALFRCIQGNIPGFLTIIPYAIFLEIFARAFVKWLPYLTLQYSLIACFAILLLRSGGRRSHFMGFVWLLLFTCLEVLNNFFPYRVDVSRAILTNSVVLLLPVIWASFNPLSPHAINRFMNNVKIAGIFLVGIVIVAHISGNIDYAGYSSSEASNGLAPVQLSGYLGVVCVFFFLSIMNEERTNYRWINIVAIGLAAVTMVLTFSRGGIYFLGILIMMYLFFNRKKTRNFIFLMILVPVLMIAYYFVVQQTQGKIIDRYRQEGASNREVLVQVGFTLFQRNPWIGVGTGNFNSVAYIENLYPVESGAHNEFIRAAAEHGLPGLIFYWGFFIVLFINILKRKEPKKQYAMYFVALFCLISIHNGLKISIQPFLLMLAVASPSLIKHKIKHARYKKHYQRVTA